MYQGLTHRQMEASSSVGHACPLQRDAQKAETEDLLDHTLLPPIPHPPLLPKLVLMG